MFTRLNAIKFILAISRVNAKGVKSGERGGQARGLLRPIQLMNVNLKISVASDLKEWWRHEDRMTMGTLLSDYCHVTVEFRPMLT
jgi:hypothetical protein